MNTDLLGACLSAKMGGDVSIRENLNYHALIVTAAKPASASVRKEVIEAVKRCGFTGEVTVRAPYPVRPMSKAHKRAILANGAV